MKIILRPATLEDYEELVHMYKDLVITVYDGFKLNPDIYFHGVVHGWYKTHKHVTIAETEDGIITGFTLAYIEDIGIVEPYYYGDLAYVKPEYRKGRSAYLLYNKVISDAEQQHLPVIAKAFVSEDNIDQVDKIQKRWGNPRFVEYHRGIK